MVLFRLTQPEVRQLQQIRVGAVAVKQFLPGALQNVDILKRIVYLPDPLPLACRIGDRIPVPIVVVQGFGNGNHLLTVQDKLNRKVSVFNVVQARVESNVPHRFPAKQLVPCHAVFVLRPKVCSPEVIVPCQFLRRVAALCWAVCLRKVEMFFRPLRKIAQHQICTV